MAGLVILGHIGAVSPANDLNYVAAEYFTWHPERTYEQFLHDRLTICYGGYERAELFLKLLDNATKKPAEIEKDRRQAKEIASRPTLDIRQRARWRNLADELGRRVKLAEKLAQEGG